LLTHLHTHLASSYPSLAQLLDDYSRPPQSIPLAYPSGASASPLSDHGLETLAIRDPSSAEESFRLLTATGAFDGPLFQRVLTATVKECTFDVAGMTAFIDLLKGADIAQLEEVAGEWALEGIKVVVGESGKGVWWVVANLVAGKIIAVEDIIAEVAMIVGKHGSGNVFFSSWMGLT